MPSYPTEANSPDRLQCYCPALQIPDKCPKVGQKFPGKLHEGKAARVQVPVQQEQGQMLLSCSPSGSACLLESNPFSGNPGLPCLPETSLQGESKRQRGRQAEGEGVQEGGR